jgi:hypothetical protein
MRVHGNRRYVKLSLAGLALGLAFAAPAHAERIGPAADDGLLAVAPDETPFVAVVRDNQVLVESRSSPGWSGQSVFSGPARLAGFAIGPGGAYNVLIEDPNGRWLTLVTSSGVTPIVRPSAKAGLLGPAGLTLDAKGAPVVAYTAMRGRSQPKYGGIPTYLRLARGQGKQLRTSAITHRGFPQSYVPPAAAPVLVNGRIHVVETYTSAAIEWEPKAHGGWIGQYLFASLFGSPVGPVSAVAAAGGSVWSAWTQEYPEFGETHVLVNLRADDETTNDAVQHGALVSLTLSDGRPELAANDWVDVGGFRDYAGLLKDASGHRVELDGRLLGYLATARGHREVLLTDANGLEWYDLPGFPSVDVSLTAAADGTLTGRVDGAVGGAVELYREQPGRPRQLVATVPLASDGSFTVRDTAATSPTLYRAVYRDPGTGIPFASLTRTPVGSG